MNSCYIAKYSRFIVATTMLLFVACSSDDDESNGDVPSLPQTVSIQQATTGAYEMKDFNADMEVNVEGNMLYIAVEGKSYAGKVSFENQKVLFDNTLDAVLTLDVGGTINPDTLELLLKTQMTFEILGDNELRFFVDENDASDEPLKLIDGVELDDMTFSVVERTTERFRLQGDIDGQIDLGGALPGTNGSQPAVGVVKITLER